MSESERGESPRNTFESVIGKHKAIYDAVNKVLSTGIDKMGIEERKKFFQMLDAELQGVLEKIDSFGK